MLLTILRVGAERLDMHDVADSSSDNDHLPTICLAHTYNATQAPVSIICIAFKEREQQSITLVIYLSSPVCNYCSFNFNIIGAKKKNQSH